MGQRELSRAYRRPNQLPIPRQLSAISRKMLQGRRDLVLLGDLFGEYVTEQFAQIIIRNHRLWTTLRKGQKNGLIYVCHATATKGTFRSYLAALRPGCKFLIDRKSGVLESLRNILIAS